MNLKPFTGPGSTPSRRRFWDNAVQAVVASQKLAGRFVTVDEHPGKGTVINAADTSARRKQPTGDTGACCVDGECSQLTEAACTEAGGDFQGVGIPCTPNPCICPSVTFSGVTWCCFGFFSITEPPSFNGTTLATETEATECDFTCHYIGSDLVGLTEYENEDCSGDTAPGTVGFNVLIARISGVWHVLAGNLSNNWLFFYGTTTDLSTPASNEITATCEEVMLDNPLTACFFVSPPTFTAIGGSGIATFS